MLNYNLKFMYMYFIYKKIYHSINYIFFFSSEGFKDRFVSVTRIQKKEIIITSGMP